jgi:hypothetical protein
MLWRYIISYLFTKQQSQRHEVPEAISYIFTKRDGSLFQLGQIYSTSGGNYGQSKLTDPVVTCEYNTYPKLYIYNYTT